MSDACAIPPSASRLRRHLPRKRGREKRRALALAVSVIAGGVAVAAQVAPPRLGRAATPDEVAKVDISIPPDGKGLPPGSGTVAQGARSTRRNASSATARTARARRAATASRGGIGSLASGTYVKTVNSYWPYATTVFDYIRRAMPITMPQSLTNDEAYAVTAYILSLDNVVPMTRRSTRNRCRACRCPTATAS